MAIDNIWLYLLDCLANRKHSLRDLHKASMVRIILDMISRYFPLRLAIFIRTNQLIIYIRKFWMIDKGTDISSHTTLNVFTNMKNFYHLHCLPVSYRLDLRFALVHDEVVAEGDDAD